MFASCRVSIHVFCLPHSPDASTMISFVSDPFWLLQRMVANIGRLVLPPWQAMDKWSVHFFFHCAFLYCLSVTDLQLTGKGKKQNLLKKRDKYPRNEKQNYRNFFLCRILYELCACVHVCVHTHLTDSSSVLFVGLYTETLARCWATAGGVDSEVYQANPARSGLPP